MNSTLKARVRKMNTGEKNGKYPNTKFIEMYNHLSGTYYDYTIAKQLHISSSLFSQVKNGQLYSSSVLDGRIAKLVETVNNGAVPSNRFVGSQDMSLRKRANNVTVLSPETLKVNPRGSLTKAPKSAKMKTTVNDSERKSITINIPKNLTGEITINVE